MTIAPSPTRAAATGAAPPRDSAGAGRGGHAVRRRGYKAIHEWVCDLSPAMLRHFRCRRVNGAYERPSIYCLRNRS